MPSELRSPPSLPQSIAGAASPIFLLLLLLPIVVALPECSFKDISSHVTFLLNTFSWLPFSIRIKYKALTGVQKVLQELALVASQIASATLSSNHSAPAIGTWMLLSAKHDFCLRTFTPAIFSAPFLHGCLAYFIQVSLEAAPHWKDCP